MQITHKFRLYPNKEIEYKMLESLELHRQTYNMLLGELNNQKVIDKAQIQGIIPDIKICDSKFKKLHSKAMQYECYKLFSNLKALAKSKEKRKVGRLRYKGKGWFKTFTYNQSGFKLIKTGKRCQTLHLSKIGDIPIRTHRNIKGQIKQITIKKEASGKWFASICEATQKKTKQLQIKKIVGIDVGLDNFIYDSEGDVIKNPRHLKKHEQKLKKLHKQLSKKKKRSNNRNKMRIQLARRYEKTANVRNDFLHKISHYYIQNYDAIGLEDMPMTVKNDWMAKSKLDASWGKLRQYIAYKAESAGKLCVLVDYKGTTQDCSQCKEKVKKELKDRIHDCPHCGFKTPRDYNSALEIKDRTIKKIGQELPEYTLVETPLTAELSKIRPTSYVSKKQEAPCEN